jgi:ABC-2 type transport system permease protein
LILGTIASVLAFTAGQAIFSTKHVDASFSDPHVARAVLGCGLFLAAMGAFGLALGALARNTAAAITTLTLVLFVVPVIVNLMPKGDKIGPYLPSAAGLTITSVSPDGPLGPWTGFGLLCGYVVATIAIAAVLLVRRDA